MARRKLTDKSTRKIIKTGPSYAVTIPIEIVKNLKWREKQKVVVKQRGSKVTIEDWKK